jgi:uncharacterized phage-associated protein
MTDIETPTAVAPGLARLAERRAQRSEESIARLAELTQRIDQRVQLRQLRNALGLTQTRAARIVGGSVTQADISRIENGEVNPSIERMGRILATLSEYGREQQIVTATATPLERPIMSVHAAAAYLCTIRDDDDSFSHMKLQKLLYYVQGYASAILSARMFRDPILAWEHGPVVRSVYSAYRTHESNTLPRPMDFDPLALDAQARGILERVYLEKGQYEAWALRAMTHNERPWKTTPLNDEIPIEIIREFFVEQLGN